VNIRILGGGNKENIGAQRIDYGAAVELGLELRNRMFISLNYTAGLKNVMENRYGALQNRNRDLRIGVGYYLKTKRQGSY
jgi:hypothetical protein